MILLVFGFAILLTAILYTLMKSCQNYSLLSSRKREIEVNLTRDQAFSLCLEYIKKIPSKKVIFSDGIQGIIKIHTPDFLFPVDQIQYLIVFEVEEVVPAKTVIKYSSRYAPGSSRVIETNKEGRNMENIQAIGSFFEKHRVSYKEK
jgi:hypothetical protein